MPVTADGMFLMPCQTAPGTSLAWSIQPCVVETFRHGSAAALIFCSSEPGAELDVVEVTGVKPGVAPEALAPTGVNPGSLAIAKPPASWRTSLAVVDVYRRTCVRRP